MMPVYVNLSNTNSSVLRVRSYSVHHLFLVLCLKKEISSKVLLGGFFLFALVSMVGMVITPANPGSFLIAACRLKNLARSSRPCFCPVGIRYVSTLVDRVVGKSSDDELHIPPVIFWRHTGVVPDL